MRLVQFKTPGAQRGVGVVSEDGQSLHVLKDIARVYDLALEANRLGASLSQLVTDRVGQESLDYAGLVSDKLLLPPLDHPDPAHCYVTGTGLDHLGSAQARNAMHTKLSQDPNTLTDSMKMFQLGLEGGKPAPDQIGAQPEWFYKGDGDCLVPPEQPLEIPSFALDGGEEAEIVGLYVIGEGGAVLRVGYALGNEFSDHILERQNYLYLAHSKLRNCSIGPELLLGPLPEHIEGTVRVCRDGQPIWSDTFLTGEANMSHSLANIEHHHFKYTGFRRPGDIHCHFFGAATLSFSAGVTPQTGDIFEISAPLFSQPLRNPLVINITEDQLIHIKTL
jgi:hypothetical protein